MSIHVTQAVTQCKAQGHFTKFKRISPQNFVRTRTCYDRTCNFSQTLEHYIPRLSNAFQVESRFYLSNFFQRNLAIKMWWTYVLLGIIALSGVEAQVIWLNTVHVLPIYKVDFFEMTAL